MQILETERLVLREIVERDAAFILDLLNQPTFIKYIGDRNVRTLEEAKEFIENHYRQSYREHGFGLYLVELKEAFLQSQTLNSKSKIEMPIGICGFVKRDYLSYADIGFAFLPQFEKKGYAFESTDALMKYGTDVLGFKRILAITTQDNENSGKLLEKIGLKFERLVELPCCEEEELKLFLSNV